MVLSWLTGKGSETARLVEAAFEGLPVAALLAPPDGQSASANASWRAIFGATEVPAATVFGGDGAEAALESLRATAAGGSRATAELRLAGEGGRWLRLSAAPIELDGPAAPPPGDGGTLWTAEDVSDLRRFQPPFDNAPVGIVLLDLEGRIEACNRAFAHSVGLASDAVVRGTFADLVAAGGDKLDGWLAAARAGTGAPPPLEVKLKGETPSEVALFAGRIPAAPGRPAGLVVHV